MLDQEIIIEPKLKQYLEVLFRSSTLPTKPLPVKPINLKFDFNKYNMPNFVVPAIYHKILFPTCQCEDFVNSINLEIMLTVNITFGLVTIKYIKLPTRFISSAQLYSSCNISC